MRSVMPIHYTVYPQYFRKSLKHTKALRLLIFFTWFTHCKIKIIICYVNTRKYLMQFAGLSAAILRPTNSSFKIMYTCFIITESYMQRIPSNRVLGCKIVLWRKYSFQHLHHKYLSKMVSKVYSRQREITYSLISINRYNALM